MLSPFTSLSATPKLSVECKYAAVKECSRKSGRRDGALCRVRGQVREGLGWYFTLLYSSTVVSTGGFFQ